MEQNPNPEDRAKYRKGWIKAINLSIENMKRTEEWDKEEEREMFGRN